jgi:hypothetical protein
MRRTRLAGFGLVAVTSAVLAGCSSSPPAASSTPVAAQGSAPSTPLAAQSSTPSTTTGDCLLGANGADVEVGIANPTDSCSQWVTNLAGIGLVWNYISQLVAPGEPGTADQETMEQVCDLTDSTGEELYVEDAGGQSYGNSICSQEEQNGWSPESSPGPLASLMQQVGQQQEQANASASAAQASASASAAQQQNIAQAQQQLQNDITTLENDSSSLNNDKSLATDINQMKSDYQTQQNDYATEQSDYRAGGCTQAAGDPGTVEADQGTIEADQGSLNADESSLQTDISGLQTDIQNVNSDVADVTSNGGAPDQDPSSALTAGQQAIKNANAAIQWATNQGDEIVSEAQSLSSTAQQYMTQHGC